MATVRALPREDQRPTETTRGVGALALGRVDLADFRSYGALRIEVGPTPVALIGQNGAGKTNLLEAISLLAPGRGLRGARLGDIARRGTGRWSVAATIDGPSGVSTIGTGIERDAANDADDPEDDSQDMPAARRVVRIDGESVRGPAQLARVACVVWVTPENDRLFIDSASARRRLLDRMTFALDPEHARRVVQYQKALRERSRLLREGQADAAWLGAVEAQIAEAGVAVSAARNEAAAALAAKLAERDGPFPKAEIAIQGRFEAALLERPALAVEDEFRGILEELRPRDAETGGAGEGPHRSDLMVRHVDKDMPAASCSTGEQKALILALALAEAGLIAAKRGAAPILLFDEVAAHLDRQRREALYREIATLGAQAWLTGTDRAAFEGLDRDAQILAVADGHIRPDQ